MPMACATKSACQAKPTAGNSWRYSNTETVQATAIPARLTSVKRAKLCNHAHRAGLEDQPAIQEERAENPNDIGPRECDFIARDNLEQVPRRKVADGRYDPDNDEASESGAVVVQRIAFRHPDVAASSARCAPILMLSEIERSSG